MADIKEYYRAVEMTQGGRGVKILGGYTAIESAIECAKEHLSFDRELRRKNHIVCVFFYGPEKDYKPELKQILTKDNI